jgi:iron complex transport system ATP-binding protein
MLAFKDIQIGYKEVLFSVPDMTLNAGQLVTLIGPNGAGKTTFLNTILGLQHPLKGKLFFNEKEFTEISKKEKTALLSHVASKFEGVNYLSIFDLISMGRAPFTNMLNVLSEADKEVVSNVIRALNLEELANKSTTEISDGERQIAMIGKALAQETDIIVLDEPTAFLDYNNRRKVLRILKTIAANQNKLILLTSHDLELCFEHSDQVIGVDEANKSLRAYSEETPKEKIIHEIFGEK